MGLQNITFHVGVNFRIERHGIEWTWRLNDNFLATFSLILDLLKKKKLKYQILKSLIKNQFIRLETKSCRILPLTHGTKYDQT